MLTNSYNTVRPQGKPAAGEDTLPEKEKPLDGVILPITRNTYRTDDYTAVVEGYKPRLVSLELYPKTTTITNTITATRSPRWALTVGPG